MFSHALCVLMPAGASNGWPNWGDGGPKKSGIARDGVKCKKEGLVVALGIR